MTGKIKSQSINLTILDTIYLISARRLIDRPQSNLKTIRGSPPGAKHKNVYRPHKQYAGKIDDLEGKNKLRILD